MMQLRGKGVLPFGALRQNLLAASMDYLGFNTAADTAFISLERVASKLAWDPELGEIGLVSITLLTMSDNYQQLFGIVRPDLPWGCHPLDMRHIQCATQLVGLQNSRRHCLQISLRGLRLSLPGTLRAIGLVSITLLTRQRQKWGAPAEMDQCTKLQHSSADRQPQRAVSLLLQDRERRAGAGAQDGHAAGAAGVHGRATPHRPRAVQRACRGRCAGSGARPCFAAHTALSQTAGTFLHCHRDVLRAC